MHADTVVALVAAGLAAIIAITVPWMTFRLALRQDRARWLRDQRAQLYVDLLTEAYAEQKHLQYLIAGGEFRESTGEYFVDLRLPPPERARLAARATIFSSGTINRLFNQFLREAQAILTSLSGGGGQVIDPVEVDRLLDKLLAGVRGELGADRIPLEPAPPASRPPKRP